MKKSILITLLVLLLSLVLVGTALAKPGVFVVKGVVTAVDEGSLTVKSNKADEPYVFDELPVDFDASQIEVGDTVMVRATVKEDGTKVALAIRVLGGKGKGGSGKPEETGKANSAFCSEDKQGKVHPLAEKLVEKYPDAGINAEWVMEYYCDGQSIGAIMLALKTAELNEEADPAKLLEQRAGGQSWGKIWQGLGMVGNEEDVKTPPGQLKKNNK